MKIKYNNADYLYNYTYRIPLNIHKNEDVFVTPKVDVIRIAINRQLNSNQSLNNFFNKINSICITKSTPLKQNKSGYNHSRKYTIKINEKCYESVLSECRGEPYMPYLLAVHEPDRDFIIEFEKILLLLDQYNLNAVEFAFDFEHENTKKLYNFLKKTVTLAWQGKPFHLPYETTHYLNNNWVSSSKAGKIYQKMITQENGKAKEVIRLEITFKQRILFRVRIRKCSEIFQIKIEDVIKYFSFKCFNFNLFINKLQRSESKLENLNELLVLFKNDISNGFLVETNDTAKTYCNNKTYLKYHLFNNIFKDMLIGGTFWDGQIYSFDSSVIEE